MLSVKTVLCPVDFSDPGSRAVAFAAALCERFGARLVLQHDVTGAGPAFLGMGWMQKADERGRGIAAADDATARLEKLASSLPPGLVVEWRLTEGPRRGTILHLARELRADLLVMASSAGSDPEHVSVTEMVIEEAPCPVLAVGAGAVFDAAILLGGGRELSVVAPLDFTPHSENALRALVEMARTLPMKVHLVTAEPEKSLDDVRHVMEDGLEGHRRKRVEEARSRLAAMVPPALAASASLDVLVGPPAREVLAEARRRSADLIVMGVHLKDPVGKAIFGATSTEVLRGSGCPVWFVPAAAHVGGGEGLAAPLPARSGAQA